MRSFFVFLAFAAAAVAATSSPASAQIVRIPGTSVAMTPPPGFRLSRNGGLEDATGSSISVVEREPEGFAETIKNFASPKTASDGFAAQGIRITRIDQIALDTGQAPLAVGDQRQNGMQFRKYISVLGGPTANANTVLITFSVTATGTLRQSDVETALRSVKLTQIVTAAQKIAQLSFKFQAVAPFRAADVLPGNQALLTSFDGADPAGNKPMILIGTAQTSSTSKETPATAERVLRNMSGFADAEIKEQGPLAFAGGDGYFLSAVAGQRTMVQFLRVLSNGTYVRLVARGETSALDAVRPAIKEIADSVTIPE
jgi:hypothetical protein